MAVGPPFPDPAIAKKYKGARWALLKNPADLTEPQAQTLAALRKSGGAPWRGYQPKEAPRAVFVGDPDPEQVMELLHRWCAKAQRCQIPSSSKLLAPSAPTWTGSPPR